MAIAELPRRLLLACAAVEPGPCDTLELHNTLNAMYSSRTRAPVPHNFVRKTLYTVCIV